LLNIDIDRSGHR